MLNPQCLLCLVTIVIFSKDDHTSSRGLKEWKYRNDNDDDYDYSADDVDSGENVDIVDDDSADEADGDQSGSQEPLAFDNRPSCSCFATLHSTTIATHSTCKILFAALLLMHSTVHRNNSGEVKSLHLSTFIRMQKPHNSSSAPTFILHSVHDRYAPCLGYLNSKNNFYWCTFYLLYCPCKTPLLLCISMVTFLPF